jgi:hypothetical protein
LSSAAAAGTARDAQRRIAERGRILQVSKINKTSSRQQRRAADRRRLKLRASFGVERFAPRMMIVTNRHRDDFANHFGRNFRCSILLSGTPMVNDTQTRCEGRKRPNQIEVSSLCGRISCIIFGCTFLGGRVSSERNEPDSSSTVLNGVFFPHPSKSSRASVRRSPAP